MQSSSKRLVHPVANAQQSLLERWVEKSSLSADASPSLKSLLTKVSVNMLCTQLPELQILSKVCSSILQIVETCWEVVFDAPWGTLSFFQCMSYDWIVICYSLKKANGVWLKCKDWDKHMSLSTREKPGAFVVPSPIWSSAFMCPALWLQWSLETSLAAKSIKSNTAQGKCSFSDIVT